MSISIATMGKFLPQIGKGVGGGGAINYQLKENDKPRMNIRITSISSIDKKTTPLNIILKCN